ncbi:MAG: glycosyltransferase N-terminal domain-containing protein [Nitrospinota bacterium]
MTFFYHILSLPVAFLLIPLFTALSLFSKNKFKLLHHHFGFTPKIKKDDGKALWFYALSLGEVKAALPVLSIIREKNPDLKIAVSVTTDSGYEGAMEHLKMADQIFFHPLDCLPFTRLALRRINPDIYVVTDTGFWPGLIDQLHQKNIPKILLNGRISQASARGYLKAGSLFKTMFQQFDRLCMQNESSRKAIAEMGVNPQSIEVTGDTKFDALKPVTEEKKDYWRKVFNLEQSTPVWVAGSTHAGEEEIILTAHEQLKASFPDLVLILAPRRIERIKELSHLLEYKKIPFFLRSKLENSPPESVILLDTLGELAEIYSLGQLAFVGRSLLPPGGGHSLLEPLSNGVAVMHGPHVENIRPVAEEAHINGLSFTVNNSNEIRRKAQEILEQKELAGDFAAKAKSFISNKKGPSEKMAEIVLKTVQK